MTYQLSNDENGNPLTSEIQRLNDDGTVTCIPNNIMNMDWVTYQAWLALGNTPEAAS